VVGAGLENEVEILVRLVPDEVHEPQRCQESPECRCGEENDPDIEPVRPERRLFSRRDDEDEDEFGQEDRPDQPVGRVGECLPTA
jgi:hypothetical protein